MNKMTERWRELADDTLDIYKFLQREDITDELLRPTTEEDREDV